MISQVIIGEKSLTSFRFKNLDIDELVRQRMPPAPGTLIRLVKLLRDYTTPRSSLITAINHDPMLVARVLRLANSPIYSFEREIILIDMALTAVGSQTIYDIVVIELAARTFNNGVNQTEDFRKVWEHSIAVAILTKKISETLEMRGLEESFICGLLHDFGKFVLLNYDSKGYQELLKIDNEFEMLQAEENYFGYNHTEVGSLVARRWNMPDEISHSILHHHNSTQSEHPNIVEHIVEIADLLANIKGYGTRHEPEEKLQYSESAMKLGLTQKFLDNIWDSAKDNISEMIKTFA